MSETAFEFRVLAPEQRSKGGKLELTYWSYRIQIKTNLSQYSRKEMEVSRRYSDFDYLRSQLSENFPWCVVPPIPEKDVQGTIEKFVSGTHNAQLLEYRQRALRKFLIRVGAHPHLYKSQILQDFCEMDEAEWERRMKGPSKVNTERLLTSALSEAGSTLSRQWNPNPAAPSGAAYSKALLEEKSTPQVWEEAKLYVGQLETSISVLKERLEQLVKRRRETAVALGEFGRSFSRVGDVEASINENAQLSNALQAVGKHSEQLSTVYVEQADQESKQVVETLNYYIGMCNAVKDTLKRLLGYITQRDQLIAQVNDLNAQREKASRGGQPEKVAKIEHDIQSTTEKRDAATKNVINVESLFKEELRRFHREKQYDVKSILKGFTELQLDYASKMRRSWEALLPTVENVKL